LIELSRVAEGFLDPIARVIAEMREHAPGIEPDRVMLVGAWCRDTLHAALGHGFETSATRDVDLALALSGWEIYELLSNAFPASGDTGVAFRIAGLTVDLLPFGELEDPTGLIVPPTRGEVISVWAFAEIFSSSSPLALSPSIAIRCPTVPGYTAAKLAAWLDRSEWGEARDANDLALAVYWYAESTEVEGRLYDTSEGQQILVDEEADFPRAAAHMLGKDVSDLVGRVRLAELVERWPGNLDMLVRNFTMSTGPRWPDRPPRRLDMVDALTRGLADPI
jgi:predicted nucleotidyltransferase